MTLGARSGPASKVYAGPWAALVAIYIIWGSTYFAIRLAIDTMPPLLMSGVRFVVAGALMYVISRSSNAPTHSSRRSQWTSAAIIGILLLGCGNGGVTVAEQIVPSGIVALLVASVPLWIAAFTWILTRSRPSPGVLTGIVIGLLGVGLLIHPTGHASAAQLALTLFSPFCWSMGTMYASRHRHGDASLLPIGRQMIAGGVVLLIAAAVHGEFGRIHLAAISLTSALALLYLIAVGSMVAYTFYVWLLAQLPTNVVATYAYVNPLVAVALGGIFLAEPITARTLVAGALIIAAVALILWFSPGGRSPQQADSELGMARTPGGTIRP